MGSHARLAAEIPDIFLPLSRNENSGMTMGGDSFAVGLGAVAGACVDHGRACERIPLRHRSNLQEKNNIVIPEFSAWLTLVLEQCRAENIRNLPRQRAPTPLFPERRPREACSMPISGCHALPLATFNLPSRNNLQNKPNSAATMSLPCSRFATAQPQRRWDAPPGGGDSGYFHSAIAK